MQIQLRQNEIVAALTGYLAQQGIAVAHKKIDISFTAGRKNTGLSADVSIEDGDIPGFTDTPGESDGPKLVVVPVNETKPTTSLADTVIIAVDPGAPGGDSSTEAGAPVVAELAANTPEEPIAAETPAAKVTNSLFN